MKVLATCGLVAILAANAQCSAIPAKAVDIEKRDASTTATVTLSSNKGIPSHLASGFIYGIPDTPNQIPDEFYTGMGFNYARAGGAQTPSKGWLAGYAEYVPRFQSVLSNYHTARKYGAKFQLLLHDLWGADGTEASNAPFPGDNGNWSSYDAFLDQVISDIKTNRITDGLEFEIWNEPDGYGFWHGTQSQWLQMWGRGYAKLRSAFGKQVPIVGPSLAAQPTSDDSWWTAFLSFVGSNSSAPDQYTWHVEGSPSNVNDDPQQDAANLKALLSTYNLPIKQFNVNEYGVSSEQQPAGAAWFISRLERNNIIGLRGNWASGYQLHDYLANLLGKPGAGTSSYNATGTGYWANGEWQVYNYYTKKMTGHKVATTGSGDQKFDVFATWTGERKKGVKVLAGTRLTAAEYWITIEALSAIGLPTDGTVSIRTYRFDFTGGTYGDVGAPVDLGIVNHTYTGDAVSYWVAPATAQTAYAFEIV